MPCYHLPAAAVAVQLLHASGVSIYMYQAVRAASNPAAEGTWAQRGGARETQRSRGKTPAAQPGARHQGPGTALPVLPGLSSGQARQPPGSAGQPCPRRPPAGSRHPAPVALPLLPVPPPLPQAAARRQRFCIRFLFRKEPVAAAAAASRNDALTSAFVARGVLAGWCACRVGAGTAARRSSACARLARGTGGAGPACRPRCSMHSTMAVADSSCWPQHALHHGGGRQTHAGCHGASQHKGQHTGTPAEPGSRVAHLGRSAAPPPLSCTRPAARRHHRQPQVRGPAPAPAPQAIGSLPAAQPPARLPPVLQSHPGRRCLGCAYGLGCRRPPGLRVPASAAGTRVHHQGWS